LNFPGTDPQAVTGEEFEVPDSQHQKTRNTLGGMRIKEFQGRPPGQHRRSYTQLGVRCSSLKKDIWGLIGVEKIIEACVGIVNKSSLEDLKLKGAVRADEGLRRKPEQPGHRTVGWR
jgi:hypothetical protein